MEEVENQRELQLLPSALPNGLSVLGSQKIFESSRNIRLPPVEPLASTSLDLQLSISLRPIRASTAGVMAENLIGYEDINSVESLKWQAEEQIRLAALEKAYAERVRELTKREIELAESEFARAKLLWERAREEVEKVEKMKDRATRQIDSTCMEITCHACHQRFRP